MTNPGYLFKKQEKRFLIKVAFKNKGINNWIKNQNYKQATNISKCVWCNTLPSIQYLLQNQFQASSLRYFLPW